MILSAYAQLRPAERVFVDAFVQRVVADAYERKDRISNALYRPIADETQAEYGEMLARPMVMAAITEQIKERASETELSAHRLVREIRSIAFSNISDFMNKGEDGWFYGFEPANCSREQLSAVQEIVVEDTRFGKRVKFRLYNKLEALKMAATMMGMLEADNTHFRAEMARPANVQLPSNVTDQEAMEAYARMANGGGE